jgi:uncharacterized membrane protein
VTRRLEAAARRLERHWLLAVNLVVALGIAGSALAPLFAARGWARLATLAYLAYRPMCPQRPDHSFFLLGHKMALEQRMLALAGGLLVGGLLFAPVRRRLRPLDWRLVVLAALPTLIDVLSQAVGLRDSTWQWRVATAIPFCLAFVWWAYPHLERTLAAQQLAHAPRVAGQPASAIGR